MDRVLAGTVALAATGAIGHILIENGDTFAESIAGSTWFLVALGALGTALTWAYVEDSRPPKHDPQHRHSHV
jgi:hypothetical protein